MNSRPQTWFYCIGHWWLNRERTAPHVVPFVATALAQSRDRYSKSIGEARLMVGNCITIMCRSPKSRAGYHFAAAIGLRSIGARSRPLPQGRRKADAAADRR